MPQMSPLSWWMLFLYFILLLILFSIMNYYIFFYLPQKTESTNIITKSMNWKW
uniref:ATP synthase complex subunit 8 n=1 Tax=Myrmeleon immanis TaxID=1495081 RepID=A0A088CB04_MYRIM|nr:ATP synthase F0 subunit 8 [Myrmeleon immanis]AHY39227.1 ATP synthase F0 subunit 8 [Myrmeleon immanis]AIT55813.1 ATP synthase F0 subunit 8 [Myrmeleon immanis]